MADGFWRIGAVNEHRACPATARGRRADCRDARGGEQRIGVFCVVPEDFQSGHSACCELGEVAALTHLARFRFVAARRIVGIDQIEKAVFPIDHNRSRDEGSTVEHHLPLQRKRQPSAVDRHPRRLEVRMTASSRARAAFGDGAVTPARRWPGPWLRQIHRSQPTEQWRWRAPGANHKRLPFVPVDKVA